MRFSKKSVQSRSDWTDFLDESPNQSAHTGENERTQKRKKIELRSWKAEKLILQSAARKQFYQGFDKDFQLWGVKKGGGHFRTSSCASAIRFGSLWRGPAPKAAKTRPRTLWELAKIGLNSCMLEKRQTAALTSARTQFYRKGVKKRKNALLQKAHFCAHCLKTSFF